MNLILLFSCVLLRCFAAAFEDGSKYISGDSHSITNGIINIATKEKSVPHNLTYIDKDENMLRVPVLNKYYEEHKSKKKTIKKQPKRTIQKIIKNKSNFRKIHLRRELTRSTQPARVDMENIYVQDEYQWQDDNASTTQENRMRKSKKFNQKIARYPMPFQRLPWKENGKRHKRSDGRNDLYILKDLDEIEFLSNDDGNDVVNVHVKKYW